MEFQKNCASPCNQFPIRQALNKANIPSPEEPTGSLRSGGKCPDGSMLIPRQGGRSTMSHTLAESTEIPGVGEDPHVYSTGYEIVGPKYKTIDAIHAELEQLLASVSSGKVSFFSSGFPLQFRDYKIIILIINK